MVNKYRLTKYLQLVFAGYLGSLGLSIFSLKALAQSNIVPDNTLSAESSQIIPNLNVDGLPSEVILGGATRGYFTVFRSLMLAQVEELIFSFLM